MTAREAAERLKRRCSSATTCWGDPPVTVQVLREDVSILVDAYLALIAPSEDRDALIRTMREIGMVGHLPELERFADAILAWMRRSSFRRGKVNAAKGHDEPCAFCGKPCNGYAGDPGQWPVPLCHPDGTGKVKWHHERCVMDRIWPRAALADLDGKVGGMTYKEMPTW